MKKFNIFLLEMENQSFSNEINNLYNYFNSFLKQFSFVSNSEIFDNMIKIVDMLSAYLYHNLQNNINSFDITKFNSYFEKVKQLANSLNQDKNFQIEFTQYGNRILNSINEMDNILNKIKQYYNQ